MILGITGTLGAGKGAIVEYLKQKGFSHYSVRNFLMKKLAEEGREINRDTMTVCANELRNMYGPAYIVEALHDEAQKAGGDAIIESIRVPGEEEALRRKGNFFLIAVDADPKLRYERAVLRGSETDKINFEKFLEDEQREMSSDDPAKQNLSLVMTRADVKIDNSATFEDLHRKIDGILEKIPRN